MPQRDYFILVWMGGVFVVLGVVALLWGRHEEKGYYDALSTRSDLREFVEHTPKRPEPRALKIGGWIAIAIGVIMLAIGGALLLWG